MRWNQKADNDILRILLRILQEQNIAIPYADIAAAFGGEITVTAVKKRIQRIRGGSESQGEGEGVEGLGSPPDAPAKKDKKMRAKRCTKPRVKKVIEGRVEKI